MQPFPLLVMSVCSAAVLSSCTCGQLASPRAKAENPAATFGVSDFGAACDGKTDDTAAVQKAIDRAEAAGGGVVEFPAGTCLLNSCRPSRHPWFFFNLRIGSHVTLRGKSGTRLLQGPGGRHALAPGASQVRNTVLAFGADYTTIRFQDSAYNGGFSRLGPTTASRTTVTLSDPANAWHFKAGDYVAVLEATRGDVTPTEVVQVSSVNPDQGILGLNRPLTRSFRFPSMARVTPLVTANVGVRNMTVEGTEPLAVNGS